MARLDWWGRGWGPAGEGAKRLSAPQAMASLVLSVSERVVFRFSCSQTRILVRTSVFYASEMLLISAHPGLPGVHRD